jgi:hypothetical protein
MAMVRTIRKFKSHEELRLAHLQEWQKLPTEVINEHAWQLVVDYRKMHDIQPHEPRLQRHVEAVRRA